MAMTLYGAVHYWLVDHPIITHFEWNPASTTGASPFFVAAAVAAYLSLTLLFRRFPNTLPTLPSAVLRLLSAAHNIVLCALSLAMAAGCALSAIHQTPPGNPAWSVCLPVGTPPRGPTFFWGHVFYLSKVLEFVDTLLILLSGSRGARRLSFLHVYHHAVVVVLCYLWVAAPQTLFPVGVVTNASVHVVMYGYYLMAALGRRPSWKRAVTDCQITQFLFGYVVSGVMLYLHFTGSGCSGIRVWGFNTLFGTSLLMLFINFHLENYAHKKKLG